ncbi:hypothetical protein GCM10008927_17800 [Amylibacter ulvae]|uniref:Pseudouridine synthase n=1 Tax=Paramylibacter ulvae TaxID=1651968 RepID=A0ABQ3D1E8_9RHOB|nr:pseudouridine synthase [Amylibacter ulvae]GHA52651.1 hypothetical protein GCM10008927_17800 [Amylibacter ulvae]
MSQEPERIAKFLARAGVASRREIERMIEAGRITLNGEVLKTPAVKVTDADNIIVDNKPAPTKQPPRFWRYYKPLGLVSTERDEKGRKTIFDDLPEDMPRTMSVGRLDINSEGLLLLTNDGGIKRKLELPATGWLRRYRVRVNGRPTDETFEPLRQGVVIDREVFAPMEVVLDRQQGANAWLTVGLREGKYREVRRAMEHVGMKVNRLIRISYGPFQLGDMEPGEVRSIPTRVFKEQLGPEGADLFDAVDENDKPKRTLKPRPNKSRGTRNSPRSDAGNKKPNKKRR